MSRDELAAVLADLVARKVLTEAEAVRIMALFDAGEFVPFDLPLVPEDDDAWLLGFAALLLLTGDNATQPLSRAKRRQTQSRLRQGFNSQMQQLGQQVATGRIPISAWQQQVYQVTTTYTRQMAIAGAGTLPGAVTQQQVNALLASQWDFLVRFGLDMQARQAVERPLSVAQIAQRSRMYGGVGWAAYFMGQGEDAGWGDVERWQSRDDGATCRICAGLHGRHFLPGQGPMPGIDCVAGGACRCQRVPEHNPQVYQRLTGQP